MDIFSKMKMLKQFMWDQQCWGKLLLKVMLLPKKVTTYVT